MQSAIVLISMLLVLFRPAESQGTLCDQARAITIPIEKLSSGPWYLQNMQFFPITFQCFVTSFDGAGTVSGTYTNLTQVDMIHTYDEAMTISSTNGMHLYFPQMPNLVMQFLDYNDGSSVLFPESLVGLLCNEQLKISIFIVYTKQRTVSNFNLMLIKLKANYLNSGLGVQPLTNDKINQDACPN